MGRRGSGTLERVRYGASDICLCGFRTLKASDSFEAIKRVHPLPLRIESISAVERSDIKLAIATFLIASPVASR